MVNENKKGRKKKNEQQEKQKYYDLKMLLLFLPRFLHKKNKLHFTSRFIAWGA